MPDQPVTLTLGLLYSIAFAALGLGILVGVLFAPFLGAKKRKG